MELKGVKPGRFHPRCTECKQKFLLQIFPDADRAPLVALEHDPKEETAVAAIAGGQRAAVAKPQAAIAAPSSVKTAAPAPARSVMIPRAEQPVREVEHEHPDAHIVGTML